MSNVCDIGSQIKILVEDMVGCSISPTDIIFKHSHNPIALVPRAGVVFKHLSLPAPLIEAKVSFYLGHPDFCPRPVPFSNGYLCPSSGGHLVCYRMENEVTSHPPRGELYGVIRSYLRAIKDFPEGLVPQHSLSEEISRTVEKIMGYPLPRNIRTRLLDIMCRYSVPAPQLTMQVIHGDIHPGNVLSTPRGPVLIDFEHICYGPAAYDFLWFLMAEEIGFDGLEYSFADIISSLGVDKSVVEECYYLLDLRLVREFLWWFKKKDPVKLAKCSAALGVELGGVARRVVKL